jgi:hypothetical protein
VSPDSAVLCQEVGSGELRWFVLENTEKPVRDFEEIALTDQRAINLLGKRVGDTFVLAPATMGDRIAVIKKIQSKYVRRFQDCMTELQVRFGPSAMVQSVFVGTPDAIMQPGMVTIMTHLQRRWRRFRSFTPTIPAHFICTAPAWERMPTSLLSMWPRRPSST